MVSIHKRSKFWTSLPIFILLMTFVSILTMGDDADDFKALFDQTQQGSVFYLGNGMEIILVENHTNPMIAAGEPKAHPLQLLIDSASQVLSVKLTWL